MKKTVAEIIAEIPIEEIARCLTSAEGAGDELKVTKRRVIAMVKAKNPAKRLPAAQIGREYVIKRSDLALVRHRKAGAPRKARA